MTLHPSDGAQDDRAAKITRLRGILSAKSADAIHLTSGAALSWLFDGARTAVPLGGPPVFSARVDRDGQVTVTALANEIDRLAEEEIHGAVSWEVAPWYASLDAAPPGTLPERDAHDLVRAARAALLPAETARYRRLGKDTARAVTEVLARAQPSWTERLLAGELVRAAYAIGAEPAVALTAGETRGAVPHPIPTDAALGARAMAVVTFVRDGLHVSMSRWVQFSRDASHAETESALREVEADAFAATRPGRHLDAVLTDIAGAYDRHGFGPDAWRAHHQGGPTGYAGRDPKAAPDSTDTVTETQAFAWNPWVPHAKTEDTVIVADGRIDVLSLDPDWPTTTVRGVARPLPLPRGE
ncbi:Xaa-Pro peptidase family protein [Microbacterium sp. G2-8]|uniref:M24 family metallopeptidase n=1 Tax=Microbacterium sp. G2-8 TaxID=2842454 RepID=UPI001C8AFACF|nr:M24 family metallopeptidase [Microbacterium sp. G2-8]